MKTIAKGVLLISILTFSLTSFSQKRDTMQITSKDTTNMARRAISFTADKISSLRPITLEFSYASPYNFWAERNGRSLPESKANKFDQFKMTINYNFLKKRTWMLGFSAGYRLTSAEASLPIIATGDNKIIDKDFHYLYSSLNFTYFSTLFKKKVIYTSSVFVDGSEQHMERIKGLITGTMVLKANQRTKLMVGLLLSIDPSIQIPILPTFTYEHKFKNGFILDILLPRNVYIRKFVFNRNGRISFGTDLDRTSVYLYNIDGTNQKYEYRHVDLNNGFLYEHALGEFIITAKTGIKWTPEGRIFRKQDAFSNPVYENKPDPTFYFNAGISFNPFTLLGKKKL